MRVYLFVLLLSAAGFAEVGLPSGEVRALGADDFFRHTGGKAYSESWDYFFVLDNGAKAYVTYSFNDASEITTQFSVWNLNGKSAAVGRKYPAERFWELKDKNTISIKDEYKMEGLPGKGHRVLFTADKDGKYFLDLKFTSAAAAQVPGDGIFTVSTNKMGLIPKKAGLFVHIPYGRVEGRIGVNGDTLSVKGYGYFDHSFQADEATKFVARSFIFTGSGNDRVAGRVNVTPSGEHFGYALSVKDGKSGVVLPAEVLEKGNNYNGKKFPSSLEVKWNELGGSGAGELPPLVLETKYQEKFPILGSIGLSKILIKLAGGEIYQLRGRSKTDDWGRVDWVLVGK
ncbi:hypothetical protein AGMMS49938_02130 [Fibrobacterales bacterium]|nr:hypothetical protein AGMMS49938_02130 [Fibrobacterales bacterium]